MKKLLAMVLVLVLCLPVCGAFAESISWSSVSAELKSTASKGKTKQLKSPKIKLWVYGKLKEQSVKSYNLDLPDSAWYVCYLTWPGSDRKITLMQTIDTNGAKNAQEWAAELSQDERVWNPTVVTVNGLSAVQYAYEWEGMQYCCDYFIPGEEGVLQLYAGPMEAGFDEWADIIELTIASVRTK